MKNKNLLYYVISILKQYNSLLLIILITTPRNTQTVKRKQLLLKDFDVWLVSKSVREYNFELLFKFNGYLRMPKHCSPHSRFTERSNLENFLHSMIPVVPSKVLPRSCIQEIDNIWLLDDKDPIDYFTLGDLWGSFDEWSAYGVGTPVVLECDRTVVQYYVPYLSAIQIYTTKVSTIPRIPIEEDDNASEWEIKFLGDGSKDDMITRLLSKNSKNTWDGISTYSSFDHQSSLPMIDRLGYLYFQYHDVSSPYWRIPLADKIKDFMPNYPRLISLKSLDLSPASWMSIAWYPIYQIPTKWYVKDLATCFLTYHTLSSSFQDSAGDCAIYSSKAMEKPKKNFRSQVALPPFGLATYRMQGDLWTNQNKNDQEKLCDLQSAADSWLKQLNFHHHDFHFFKMHS